MSLPERFEARLRPLRIIVFALATGAALFLAVAGVVSPGEKNPAEREESPLPLGYVAVGLAVMALGGRAMLPRLMEMQGRRQIRGGKGVRGADEEEKLVNIYQGRVIVGAALLEGAAFMGGIAYMVERSLPGLAVAIICIAAILLWDFPNRSRMGEWLDEQKRLLHAGQ